MIFYFKKLKNTQFENGPDYLELFLNTLLFARAVNFL